MKELMRKTKTEAAATRDRILATTSGVVLQKGLAMVGMRDLMQAAGLTPGGFYRHFASRDELIAEAIRTAFDRLLAMLEMEKASKAQAQQLGHIVGVYLGQSRQTIDGIEPFLCPLAQLGAELKHAAPVVQAEGFEGYRRLVKLVAGCLAPSTSPTDESRAEFIVSTLVGAVTLANLASDKESGLAILNGAKVSLTRHK